MNSLLKNVIDIKVRASNVDVTGAIFHPHYLSWFSDGRWELMKSRNVDMLQEKIFHLGKKSYPIKFVVGEVFCRIHAPSRVGDLLSLETYISEVKERTITFKHRLFHKGNDVLLAEGYGVWVCCDIETSRSRKMPIEVKDFFLQNKGS